VFYYYYYFFFPFMIWSFVYNSHTQTHFWFYFWFNSFSPLGFLVLYIFRLRFNMIFGFLEKTWLSWGYDSEIQWLSNVACGEVSNPPRHFPPYPFLYIRIYIIRLFSNFISLHIKLPIYTHPLYYYNFFIPIDYRRLVRSFSYSFFPSSDVSASSQTTPTTISPPIRDWIRDRFDVCAHVAVPPSPPPFFLPPSHSL
jgi:hypothetical protein